MSTLDDVLVNQRKYGVLQAPTVYSTDTDTTPTSAGGRKTLATATQPTTQIAIKNNTNSSNCWAYITGLDINKNMAVFMLQSDGSSAYYPTSPSTTLSPLQANCHIKLGAPGSSVTVTIPQLAGGRVWLCKDAQLVFRLNPGPGVVEPSVTNPDDPNYNLFWTFAEFTYDKFQMFANVTYVDFVGLPVSLQLENTSGQIQKVPGIPSNGLDAVCSKLQAQDAKDNAGWSKLIIKHPNGTNLRALSPNSACVMNPNLFLGYYQPYVNAVWAKYSSSTLSIDTQRTDWGRLNASVVNGNLNFPNLGAFVQPSARDIFACDSGAFAYRDGTTRDEMANITARLAAAFNRSTLLTDALQPLNETVASYYQDSITNHYARIVHEVVPDHRGYTFPYDDVKPDDNSDVAGTVADGAPVLLTVSFGGPTAPAKPRHLPAAARYHARRGLEWHALSADEEKAALAERDAAQTITPVDVDLEKGLQLNKLAAEDAALALRTEEPSSRSLASALIPAAARERLRALLERAAQSPAYRYAQPAIAAAAALLQLSLQTLVGRAVVVAFLLLCSFLLGFFGRPDLAALAGGT